MRYSNQQATATWSCVGILLFMNSWATLLILFSQYFIRFIISHTCTGFMTILSGRKPWMEQEKCEYDIDIMDGRIRLLSAHMGWLNSKLTVFTTYPLNCTFNYSRVEMRWFNASELFEAYNFGEVTNVMSDWTGNIYTRVSDVLRLALSHRFQMTYIDADIVFLSNNASLFQKPFTGACVWYDHGKSLEISNSAFCLPQHVLLHLLSLQKQIILYKSQKSIEYRYTELGPMIFSKILLNNYSISYYAQNSPKNPRLLPMIRMIREYDMIMLHITRSIRKVWGGRTWEALGHIRSRLNLPNLTIPKSTNAYLLDHPHYQLLPIGEAII